MDDKILDDLHTIVAAELLDRIKSGEATSADLSVARQFLKDNGATYEVMTEANPAKDLLKDLPFDSRNYQ